MVERNQKPETSNQKIFFLVSVLGFLLSTLLQPAFAEIHPFAELWNNFAYYDTNVERKGFASLLGRFEGKLGIYLGDTPYQLYGVYYGVASQDEHYWNNAIYAGAGLRFRPFADYASTSWQDEWIKDVKIFVESLSSNYLKDAASAEADRIPKTDTRYGFDLWHEWNLDNPDESIPWGELWSNLSWRSTSFSWRREFNDYIFYFQPKVGWHLGKGIETYLRGDLTYSGKSDYWLNVADYGVGIRFEPWRRMSGSNEFLKKFKMFVEVLGVSYLKDKPPEPNKEVSSDIRFGIDFSYGR